MVDIHLLDLGRWLGQQVDRKVAMILEKEGQRTIVSGM